MRQDKKERMLPVHTVARELQLSRRTVRRKLELGEIEGTKTSPRKWLVPESALESYLEKLNS